MEFKNCKSLKIAIGFLIFAVVSCQHAPETPEAIVKKARAENTRLAQVQIASLDGSPVQGTARFEQMPNSMLVTFHLQGLTPKETYQVYIREGETCQGFDLKKAKPLSQTKADKTGEGGNTFKTEDFSVSADHPMVGGALAVALIPVSKNKKKPGTPRLIGCGLVEPATRSSASAPTTPEAED